MVVHIAMPILSTSLNLARGDMKRRTFLEISPSVLKTLAATCLTFFQFYNSVSGSKLRLEICLRIFFTSSGVRLQFWTLRFDFHAVKITSERIKLKFSAGAVEAKN